MRLGVAVSGGPDSLALLLLARAAHSGLVEAATVDHGLRAESAAEATMVAEICARLDVRHVTLKGEWNHEAAQGLQAAARAYRYRELARWCATRKLDMLLTGHHADDQAETLLMRLARGAGLGGLAGIRPVRPLFSDGHGSASAETPIFLARPLLHFTRRELGRIVDEAGLDPISDPSNESPRFDRTRARRLLSIADWPDPRRISASTDHLAEAEAALCWATDKEYASRVEEVGEGVLAIRTLDPAGLPVELLRRIVLRLLAEMEPEAGAPRGAKLASFIDRLRGGENAMLGGVLALPGRTWRFTFAPARRTRPKS